jgi:MFS family permease
MLDKDGARTPVSLGVALWTAGLVLPACGFPAQSLALILIGTVLGGAGSSFINPVRMAGLSKTPLEQRGMLAGILPLAGNFGTAFWVALLTAGRGSIMSRCMVNNTGATEAAAQASALGLLAWIDLAATLVTLFVALKLPKPTSKSPLAATAASPPTLRSE